MVRQGTNLWRDQLLTPAEPAYAVTDRKQGTVILYNIQSLRAFAAYLVVLVHLSPLMTRLGVSQDHIGFGTVGVDLFFVISGFVMVYTTATKPVRPTDFMLNRVVRIVPMYWLITIILFLVALFFRGLLGTTEASLSDLAKSLFFIPYWKSPGLAQPLLFLGWTLNYEMFFYFIFAATLYLSNVLIRTIIVTSILFLFVLSIGSITSDNVFIRFYSAPIILEFAMGMWIALLHIRGFRLATPVAYVSVIFGLILLIGQDFVYPGHRVIFAGAASSSMLLGVLSLERDRLGLHNSLIQLIGASSYSLYLTHPFVTQAGSKIVDHLPVLQSSTALVIVDIALFVLVGAVAVAAYYLVERPLTASVRRAACKSQSIIYQWRATRMRQ